MMCLKLNQHEPLLIYVVNFYNFFQLLWVRNSRNVQHVADIKRAGGGGVILLLIFLIFF